MYAVNHDQELNYGVRVLSCPVLSGPVAISCCAADFFLFRLSLSQKYFSQLLKQCVWDELGTAQ